MKSWITGVAVAAGVMGLIGAGRQPGAEPKPAAAPAAESSLRLEDAAFLAGAWKGLMEGDLVEEHWTAPAGGNITGMFRWIGADGTTRLVELLTISKEKDGVVLRLRHFDGALTPWKSEVVPVALTMVEAGPSKAVFRAGAEGGSLKAVTYEARDGTLSILVEFPGDREPLRFSLKRGEPLR